MTGRPDTTKGTTMNNEMMDHVSRAEFEALKRLVDGVKDAVGLVADHAVVDLDRAKETGHLQGRSLYAVASETIARAQQPPATATGEPVVIDPAASAAAETNERATEGGGQ